MTAMVESAQPPPEPATPRRRAVALRYDAENESAPRVLAKGQGDIAERIIKLAEEHGIPLHEDKDLVRLLSILDLDVEVPPTLYRALAEVLSHIYRANGQAQELASRKK